MLFVNSNRREMEKKADKEIVELKFKTVARELQDLKEMSENRARRMEEHHTENSQALKDILRELRVR